MGTLHYHYSPTPALPFSPKSQQLHTTRKAHNDEIEQRLRPKAKPLPPSLPSAVEAQVQTILKKQGVVAKCAREQVTDKDIARLQPGEWLNDEIINFYGAMILARSEQRASVLNGVKKATGKGQLMPNVHYFSTFFWPKLTGEGYEQTRLSKWTKKVRLIASPLSWCKHVGTHNSLSSDSLTSSPKTWSSSPSTTIICIGPRQSSISQRSG